MLILVDLLVVIVLGLLLYAISARDPAARPGLFDSLQLALIVRATWRGRLGWPPNAKRDRLAKSRLAGSHLRLYVG